MLHSLLTMKTCQVCMKTFPNGKALGGHMRSHARKRSARKAEPSTRSTIPTLQTSNNPGANFTPRETVLVRSVHTNDVGVGPKPDRKIEEGEQQIAGKRKFLFDLNEVYVEEPDEITLTVEEESALLLVEMSKDKRPTDWQIPKPVDPPLVSTREGKEKCTEKYIEADREDEDHVKFLTLNGRFLVKDSDEEEDDDDDDETYLVARDEESKKRYKCEICGMVLPSYQALGGHRKSHKKKRVKVCDKTDQAGLVKRQYECEICNQVFASGQALGGHKKAHLVYLQPCR